MSVKIVDNEIEKKIFMIRGFQVMVDRDLAELYGVETRVLNQAVKRNSARFPESFMFQLNQTEFEDWKSQIVIFNKELMGLRKVPNVFTGQGVSMLSAVLKSDTAIQTSIDIINTFVKMRTYLSNNAGLFQRIERLEEKQQLTDHKLETVLNAIEDRTFKPKQGLFFKVRKRGFGTFG